LGLRFSLLRRAKQALIERQHADNIVDDGLYQGLFPLHFLTETMLLEIVLWPSE
jgi:hypothetical protein